MDNIDRSPKAINEQLKSDAFNMARFRMQKKAEKLVKKAAMPHDGIWYWIYLKPNWKLISYDFPIKDRIDFLHINVWRDLVSNHLAPFYKWNKDVISIAQELPYGTPRGRVSAERIDNLSYFFIRHGNDTPIPKGLDQIIEKYNLKIQMLEGLAEFIYDPHETMVKEQQQKLRELMNVV